MRLVFKKASCIIAADVTNAIVFLLEINEVYRSRYTYNHVMVCQGCSFPVIKVYYVLLFIFMFQVSVDEIGYMLEKK